MMKTGMLRPLLDATQGVPCLLVSDICRGIEYYRDVLDFPDAEPLGDPPTSALLRRDGGAVLLQQVPDGASTEYSHRRLCDQSWDALFFVADIERVAGLLRERGARIQVGVGITNVSDRTLELRDDWGNVLAFAEARIGLRAAVRDAIGRIVPARLSRAVRERRRRREELPHFYRMRDFIASIEAPDPFYMFFTEGMLHWVRNAERLVPADVNLVLIGSALPPDERRWLREQIARPMHNIELGVDDNTTWEFLFDANRGNFGYLDADCFVLNPDIFREMTRIEPTVAINGIWTYDATSGRPIACTHFVFVNAAVAARMRARGEYLSPTNYDWEGATLSLLHPRDYCRVPTMRQRRILLQVLPPDERGRPRPPGGNRFFDTLVAYQVAAYAAGYRTQPVRPLAHRTEASLRREAGADRAPVWQQDMSDELVHVGGVSYYQRWFHTPRLRGMYLAAEYALIEPVAQLLPPAYTRRLRMLETELTHLGVNPADTAELIHRHLVHDRRVSSQTAARILDVAGTRPVQRA
jgi:hypothetical protein